MNTKPIPDDQECHFWLYTFMWQIGVGVGVGSSILQTTEQFVTEYALELAEKNSAAPAGQAPARLAVSYLGYMTNNEYKGKQQP
jgi:hypothetical protein